MIAKTEPEVGNEGPVFDFDGVVSRVEQFTNYIADAVFGFENVETYNTGRRKYSARSKAVGDDDDTYSYVSHVSCGSVSCVSSIATPTVVDRRDSGGIMERYTSEIVRAGDEVDTRDESAPSIILVPFIAEQCELLAIKVNSMATSNFAYVVDVPPTVAGRCKELRPGDVIAPYQLDSKERPTPFTLAEYADFVMSSKTRPLRFVILRSATM